MDSLPEVRSDFGVDKMDHIKWVINIVKDTVKGTK
jgi:hypothetical protein